MTRAAIAAALAAAAFACGPEGEEPGPGAANRVVQGEATERGGASCLEVAPEERVFSVVEDRGCFSRKWVRLANACALPVRLREIRAAPPDGEFTIVGVPWIPAAGFDVLPGGSIDVGIRFAPKRVGTVQSTLDVEVDHASDAARSWTLTGEGGEPAPVTDEWRVPEPPGADVLFVIDNAAGFDEHLLSLRVNLASLGKYFRTASAKTQVAIATTGGTPVSAPGALLARADGARVLNTGDDAFESDFKDAVRTITASDPTIGVLDAALLALREGRAAGLLRDRVFTSIVLVTHRTDTSSVSAFDFLGRVGPAAGERERWMLAVNAIAGFGWWERPPTDDGTLTTIVAFTNGVRENIYTPDWSKALENLSKLAFGFRTWWPLSVPPDLRRDEIDVFIDGVPIPSVDPRGAPIWAYDHALQSVVFEPMYVPEPGQTLRATYLPLCPP